MKYGEALKAIHLYQEKYFSKEAGVMFPDEMRKNFLSVSLASIISGSITVDEFIRTLQPPSNQVESKEEVSFHIKKNGYVEWLNEKGQHHRTDGPAFESADGYREWYVNGNLHRTDGPAVEYADGDREWWVNGNLHRIDGPAIEYANGDRYWYVNGKLHRTDGPAVEWANGVLEWWENGKRIPERNGD